MVRIKNITCIYCGKECIIERKGNNRSTIKEIIGRCPGWTILNMGVENEGETHIFICNDPKCRESYEKDNQTILMKLLADPTDGSSVKS